MSETKTTHSDARTTDKDAGVTSLLVEAGEILKEFPSLFALYGNELEKIDEKTIKMVSEYTRAYKGQEGALLTTMLMMASMYHDLPTLDYKQKVRIVDFLAKINKLLN